MANLERVDVPTFNLLNEPWILCMDAANTQRALSIRDIFSGRGNASRVVGDSPTQDYAIMRLLLAIFWRAHAGELDRILSSRRARGNFEWGDWFADTRRQLVVNQRDDVVLEYLEKYEDRFDLLSPTEPFMQVADLHKKNNEHKPVSYMVPEAAGDYFTMRTGAGRKDLSLAEAARWLVHLQAYDYTGKKSGAVGDDRVKDGLGSPIGTGWTGCTGGTLVQGPSGLIETLILNTAPACVLDAEDAGAVAADKAVWERAADTPAQRDDAPDKPGVWPKGAADLATWQARRVRLFLEGDRVTGVLVSNGDRIPDAGKNVMGDPMTPYRYNPKQSKKGLDAFYPRPYDPTRTMWRALDALIAVEGDEGFDDKKNKAPKRPANLSNLAQLRADQKIGEDVLDVSLISMEYGHRDSSVASTFSASIGMPLVILREDALGRRARRAVRNAAERTTDAANNLGWFAGQLLVAAGGKYAIDATATDRLYAHLEPRFVDWMTELGAGANSGTEVADAFDELQNRWQGGVRLAVDEHAQELIRGAGNKAIIGREVKGHDDSLRIVSAGTLYRQLQRRLDKNLPLTARVEAPAAAPETTPNPSKENHHA